MFNVVQNSVPLETEPNEGKAAIGLPMIRTGQIQNQGRGSQFSIDQNKLLSGKKHGEINLGEGHQMLSQTFMVRKPEYEGSQSSKLLGERIIPKEGSGQRLDTQVFNQFMNNIGGQMNLSNKPFMKLLKQNQNPKMVASQLASLYLQNHLSGPQAQILMGQQPKQPQPLFPKTEKIGNLLQPTEQQQQQQKLQTFALNSMVVIARKMKIEKEIVKEMPEKIQRRPQQQEFYSLQRTKQKDTAKEASAADQYYKYYLGGGNNVELVRRVLSTREDWLEVRDFVQKNINFKWQQGQKGFRYERLIGSSVQKQLVNHFEFHREISNKQFLLKNMTYLCEQFKLNVFDYVPLTFILDFNDEQIDYNITSFLQFFDQNSPNYRRSSFEAGKKYLEIKKKLRVKQFFLYNIKGVPTLGGEEGDILFATENVKESEGYIRTSSEKFQTEDLENDFIHLTNNAVQKYSTCYGQFEAGNQLSFDDLQNYLKKEGYKLNFREKIIPRIKDLIWMSLVSVRKKINQQDRKFSFEIFGYDFILDEEANPWLIEVNTNPCIEESSPLLEELLPRMLDDAFQLTLDVIFPKKSPVNAKTTQSFHEKIKNYSNSENMWDELGNINDTSLISQFRRFQDAAKKTD